MRTSLRTCLLLALTALCRLPAHGQQLAGSGLIAPEPTHSRIVEQIDDQQLTRVPGSVFPLARPEFDKGQAEASLPLERMVLVLTRSAKQQAELDALNKAQYDSGSPLYHHWLHADEIGRLFGPSDDDMARITGWLTGHGFAVTGISKGRVTIEFSGTAAQVQNAFHTEMHHYLVEGRDHLANNTPVQIPQALAPVVAGIFSLNDFRHKHQSFFGDYIKRDLHTGRMTRLGSSDNNGHILPSAASNVHPNAPQNGTKPQLGYTDNNGNTVEDLTPYDVATIYNILPLWNQGINGNGVTVAIIGVSDIVLSDVATYRRSFGLPAKTPTIIVNGTDPGQNDGRGENTEDVEMASATAPGAQIDLVVSKDTNTTGADVLSAMYIIDHEVAPIASGSYGQCELALGSAGNQMYNQLWQQAATSGISVFMSSGDQGSAGCNSQNAATPNADTTGLQVNGIASSPYLTAVGGTDFSWSFTEATKPISTYWNTTNNPTTLASAKGYIPEITWNSTCTNPLLLNIFTDSNGNRFPNTESLCNAAINGDPDLVKISAGSGGVSHCTTPSGSTSATCSGGYAKPSWQAGPGVPNDGKRDLPDVSMFASYGFSKSTGIASSTLLICQASNSPENSCDYTNPDYIIYQENGGTSAAAPLTAGIMALVLQKTGTAQGLANPVFYQLAAHQNTSACNSSTVANGNSCIFYDTTQGTNTQVCITGGLNCVTTTSGDQVGELSGYSSVSGYDASTGLGTPNVTNLVNAWPTSGGSTSTVTLTPTSLAFPSTAVGSTSAAQVATLKNTGTTTVTINSLSITGTNASSFIRSASTCGTSLAAGASCTVSIQFKPAATGSATASLSIADTATGSPQTVALSGTGTSAAATVTVSPTSIAFPSTAVGSTSAAQSATLTNNGTSAITISGLGFSGTNASSFLRSASTCSTSLAAGASCTVSIQFKPTATGTATATFNFTDSAANSPQTVALTGTGTAASSTVTVSPTSIAFPSTAVGSTSSAQTVTVKNNGTSAITISGLGFTGTNASSFIRSASTCTTSLAAGASCTVSIQFKPTAAGSATASFAVTDNAAGSPQTVALTGTGTTSGSATVTLNPTSVAFPNTPTGTSTNLQTVTLTNSGTTTLTITTIALAGTNATSFTQVNQCGTSLAGKASCPIYVAFKPVTTGALTATLQVTDNASGSPQSVTLTGTGTAAPTVKLSATSLTFASTPVGTATEAQTVTLTNQGTSSLSITSVLIGGTGGSSFQQVNNCVGTLAANASCSLYVAFKPTTTGSLTATLNVYDTATGSPQQVTLSGTGR